MSVVPAASPPPFAGIVLPVPKPPARISVFRWALWWAAIGLALLIFYGIFSIGWIGLRLVAGIADRRSRRRTA